MNELDKILESNEKILWTDKPKYPAYITSMLIGIISFLAIGIVIILMGKFSKLYILIALVIAVLIFIYGQLSYKNIQYAITNKRIIIQSGVVGRDFKTVDYDKVQNAFVNVGVIGKIFNTGDVKFFSGAMESTSNGGNRGSTTRPVYDTFSNVSNAYDVLKLGQENLSKRKEKLYSGKA